MSNATGATARPLTENEQQVLAILADFVIPPSAEYGVPGAGDPAILAAIIADGARQQDRLIAALVRLEERAREYSDAGFADLPPDRRAETVAAFRERHPADANLIANLAAQCYYRDDRVMASLGMEARPPHPQGYEVEQGDWSLLDPVRNRADLYRKTQ